MLALLLMRAPKPQQPTGSEEQELALGSDEGP
jgi:hypothetical protein